MQTHGVGDGGGVVGVVEGGGVVDFAEGGWIVGVAVGVGIASGTPPVPSDQQA